MSSAGFFCARTNPMEEEEEELVLDSCPNISRQLAEKVRKIDSEKKLLEYIVEKKPSGLKWGREHYLEDKQLDEYMSGLCLKLDIHGYEDRGNRLKYLYNVLRGKFSNKENVFKIVVQFLMDMSQRPTGVTNLEISSQEYSADPEEEENSVDEDSERQKALLKEILGEDPNELTGELLNYSSGSDLSEWSDDDEQSISERSNNDLPPVTRPVRTSSSFGEFSDICPPPKPDLEKMKREADAYWANEKVVAEKFLHNNIRRFDTVGLTSQPVISSRLVLQARFGEYWEWKQRQKVSSEPHLRIAFTEDCIRELLWQFVTCTPNSSPIFNCDWTVKSDLMTASLTKSTFHLFLNRFGQVFSKLQILRKFQKDTMSACVRDTDVNELLSPSKVYRNYAAGLQDISIYIMNHISKIEKELQRLPRPDPDPGPAPCSTFIQLERQTRSIVEIIELVYKIHSKCISCTSEFDANSEENMPWLTSLKLISCLEVHLVMETRPSLHGVLLFLYTKCLQALLDEILSTLKTLKWDERYSLFVRDTTVRLNDLNFWSDCIKIRQFQEKLSALPGENFIPLMSFHKLLPKVLNILKTCEVFDQLEEDFTQILGDSSNIFISVKQLVHEFLEESLPGSAEENEKLNLEVSSSNNGEHPIKDLVDYFRHFDALGLGSSLASNCFRFLADPDFIFATNPKSSQRQKCKRDPQEEYRFEDLVKLSKIPIKAHCMTLDNVLSKWFEPYCASAKQKIENIFKEYKVLECMTIFQEIILTVREDFARGIIELASVDNKASQEYKYEDSLSRNSKFQKLLRECYPEGREIFSIDLKLDRTSEMNCTFEPTPKFPLNLIVTPQSVAGYIFIGRQLHRIRKSLWNVNSLSMKSCKSNQNQVDINRMLVLRFCLINFCSSLRSFFMLKVFSKNFGEYAAATALANNNNSTSDGGDSFDLDSIRKVHENYLEGIQTKMLCQPLIENILIRKMSAMSEMLRKHWNGSMTQANMMLLEDTLKKCWHVVNDFELAKYSPDFNQLSYHFGRPPSYLTN